MSNIKAELKKLPIKDALELLTNNVKDSNNFIMIQARYNGLQNQNMLGTISSDNYETQMSRIRASIIHFIDELDEDDLQRVKNKLEDNEVIELTAKKEVEDKMANETSDKTEKILFCASNPSKLAQLNVYKEYYELASNINSKEKNFELVQIENTTPNGFIEAVISHKPDYVHFAGHGVETDKEKQKLAEELEVPF